MKKPNIVFVFSDQHRKDAIGCYGDPNVKTPNMDELNKMAISFDCCISNAPVCGPYRASLMTGVYPLTHGVFVNDVSLYDNIKNTKIKGFGQIFKDNGYSTAYIGKWHLDGNGRSSYIPPERQLGFDYTKTLECTHDYFNSYYFTSNSDTKFKWDGYDTIAQTKDAVEYIKNYKKDNPFLLMLSFGTPHNPYDQVPDKYKELYPEKDIQLKDNVPEEYKDKAKKDLSGYYSHITAIDEMIGLLKSGIKEKGIEENTIFIYTSDHGDMLYSQGLIRKQKPWDESIKVPFFLDYPKLNKIKTIKAPFSTPDILPTILQLCNIPIPEYIQGYSFADVIINDKIPDVQEALIECIHPAGEYAKINGGMEYRGLRTKQYTYVRNLKGPWLLFDNINDSLQLKNQCENKKYTKIREKLDLKLDEILKSRNDSFLDGMHYIKKWGYKLDKTGTVPYKD